jgi:hypothetical protein
MEILEGLTFGDIFIGALFSARSTKRMHEIARKRAKKRYLDQLALERLVKTRLVNAKGEILSINASGLELFKKTSLVKQMLSTKVWDRKWRVVIFDIPQSMAPLRWEIRGLLKRAGFRMLQQSVWIFPHECKELTALISQDSRIKGRVLYGVFETIEGDKEMRRAFGLV